MVDPGGHTLAQLNSLAGGGSGVAFGGGAAGGAAAALSGGFGAGAAGGAGAALDGAAHGTSVDAFTRGLQGMFGYPTDWAFSGGAGGGVGTWFIAEGGGTLAFSSPTGGTGTLGGTLGINGGPDFTFTYSTPSMWSAPTGNLRARNARHLVLADLAGPMFIFSFSATSTLAGGNGASMTIYLLGVSTIVAAGSLLYPPALLSLASYAASTANAMGVTLGQVKGADASVTVAPGYGRLTT